MKNTEINIIRINEDVITTSTCQHPDKEHIYTENNITEFEMMAGDSYAPNTYTIASSNELLKSYDWFSPTLNSQSPTGIYYYYDGETYRECKGDHSMYERDNTTYSGN